MNRHPGYIMVVVSVAIGAVSAMAQGPGGPPAFSVEVQPVHRLEVARTADFTGSLEPWRTIDLSTQIAGIVAEIPIEEGELLAPDALVTRLDSEAAQIELDQAQAQLRAAQAELDRLTAGYRTEEIDEARRSLEEQQAQARLAREEWERNRGLIEAEVISRSEGDRFRAAAEQAEAAVAQAQARYNLVSSGFRTEEIDIAQAVVDQRKAAVAEAERVLRRHRIHTTLRTAVVRRLVEPGEWVTVGDPVAQLVVLDPLKVRINVPQQYMLDIRPGQAAQIEIDGLAGRSFEARVDHIVPNAGVATRNIPVLMRLPNPEGILSSGFFARVRLQLDEATAAIVVPREALLTRGDRQVVLVADPIPRAEPALQPNAPQGDGAAAGAPAPDATIRELTVRPFNEFDRYLAIEVIDGGRLEDGDRVVSLGGTSLQTGMPVRIIPSDPWELTIGKSDPPRASRPDAADAPATATLTARTGDGA